jgi:hypothetical protein
MWASYQRGLIFYQRCAARMCEEMLSMIFAHQNLILAKVALAIAGHIARVAKVQLITTIEP